MLLRLSLALALCAPATGVLAAPADDAAPFLAKPQATAQVALEVAAPASAGVEKSGLEKPAPAPAVFAPATKPTPSLSDRALGLAAGVNRFFSPALALELPGEAGEAPQTQDSQVKTVLQKALALLGTPYRWGGTDPDKGFDCSGLVGYVFRNALGIELPRVSRDMAKSGELVTDRAKLTAGDLVFFGRKGRVDHVGIYVGEGRFVHAPSRGKDVTVSSLDQGYWSGRFMQARRVGIDGI